MGMVVLEGGGGGTWDVAGGLVFDEAYGLVFDEVSGLVGLDFDEAGDSVFDKECDRDRGLEVVVPGPGFPSLSPSSSSSDKGALVQAGPLRVVVETPFKPQPVNVALNRSVQDEEAES